MAQESSLSIAEIVDRINAGETVMIHADSMAEVNYFRNRVSTIKSRQEKVLNSIIELEPMTLKSKATPKKLGGYQLKLWLGKKIVTQFTVTIIADEEDSENKNGD